VEKKVQLETPAISATCLTSWVWNTGRRRKSRGKERKGKRKNFSATIAERISQHPARGQEEMGGEGRKKSAFFQEDPSNRRGRGKEEKRKKRGKTEVP